MNKANNNISGKRFKGFPLAIKIGIGNRLLKQKSQKITDLLKRPHAGHRIYRLNGIVVVEIPRFVAGVIGILHVGNFEGNIQGGIGLVVDFEAKVHLVVVAGIDHW